MMFLDAGAIVLLHLEWRPISVAIARDGGSDEIG